MRKKGPIWEERYQKLIVEGYSKGMFISDILKLPEIAELSSSEYTIRNILKANGVKANWRKKKRKPEFWSRELVDKIVELRNAGRSIRAIRDEVNSAVKNGRISKSTIVRVLEANAGVVRFRPSRRRDIWKPQVVREIVRMYESGLLINDIRRSESLREYRPSGYVIRDILKSQGVKLTWKKGELRRWPQEAQQKVAELYRTGLKFSEIIEHSELKKYRPTNYAVRKMLKKQGVKTKGETRYKQPVSEERFKLYCSGSMNLKEEAIIHKHLAVNEAGRKLMVVRMGLGIADRIPAKGRGADKVYRLQANARSWADFFSWGVRILSDETVKRHIIVLGIEFGSALRVLQGAFKSGDEKRKKKAWMRAEKISERMSELYDEVLRKPASTFEIRSVL
jgi:hypothetical protein